MPVRRADDTQYTLGTAVAASGPDVLIRGGEYIFMVSGTPSGATLSLQVQMPDGTYSDVSVYSGSAVKATVLPYAQTGVSLPAGIVRVGVTGGASPSVSAYLVGLG